MSYDRFENEQLVLRDELALDRTRLANERTLLAYARTGLMVVVTGATAIKVLSADSVWMLYLGWLFILLGVVIGLYGVWKFVVIKQALSRLR